MKKLVIITAASIAFFASASAMAAQPQNGCDIKKQKIEKQIEYAKAHGNSHQMNGLQRALDNVNAYCTPESLYRDSQKEVAEKMEKVKEREAELLEEKQKGNDSQKIAKRERKLAEAQEELSQAQAELKTYKEAL
ncbi:DUF1090 domain-containing protein [Providencia heimbachae]|uniref:DUF1090 domain-containing protein n=1 Tax=Providencia heimbachae TaxID=333962 RepID=UPI0010BF2842|nr:DUF1090 domain-containing protein [Providencia heimbachae]QCJ68665.1 DUF1090 domain-containing protein [Providencia heimbachae]